MSVDLFVVREPEAISAGELESALQELTKTVDGLSLFSTQEGSLGQSAYYWQAARATVDYFLPEASDFTDEEPEVLRRPYVVVSARSGAWPWIEFTAVELAKQLKGRVYDPQSGSFYERLVAEHGPRSLRALHDEDLRAWQPTLVSSYWAHLSLAADDRTHLERIVAALGACAAEVLNVEPPPALRSQQINFWHTFRITPELAISASTSQNDGKRSVYVSGPQSSALVHSYAAAVASRLPISFRRVDEYT